jgi:hypothetical protein
MKKLSRLTSIISAMAALVLVAGCQTVATNQAELAASKKEFLLAQAGFKVKTVTTPKQQQHVSQLAVGRVSAVNYKGKLYYVYPTAKKDQIYFATQAQFNAYKKALAAQKASGPAQQGQEQMAGYVDLSEETAGPHHIEVEEFDSFGPMGVESLGNW